MLAAGASGNSQTKESDCRVAAQREKEREKSVKQKHEECVETAQSRDTRWWAAGFVTGGLVVPA
jgi:hypothetical protein